MRISLERELKSIINAGCTISKYLPLINISSIDGERPVEKKSDLQEESIYDVEVIDSS